MNLIRITQSLYEQIRAYHLATESERLSFLFGRWVPGGERNLILVPEQTPWQLADDCYDRQHSGAVTLNEHVHWAVLQALVKSDCDVLINVHDHPFSKAGTSFSPIDDHDDVQQDQFLRQGLIPWLQAQGERAPDLVNCSLVLDHDGLAGRITDSRGSDPFTPVDAVDLRGWTWRRIWTNNSRFYPNGLSEDETFDRQRDFIPPDVQGVIGQARIGLVGAGGLGSILSEGLARLGCRDVVVVDDDILECSNLNRWQGGRPEQVGQPKAAALAENLQRAFRKCRIDVHTDGLFGATTAAALGRCDLLVGAVDNDVARYALNRLSTQYLIPYVDGGVGITLDDGVDFHQRVTTMVPEISACLECRTIQVLDFAAVAEAFSDPISYAALRSGGYIVDTPVKHAASCYPHNLLAAGMVLTELTNLVCNYRPLASLWVEHYRGTGKERADADNYPQPPAADCVNCSLYPGKGDSVALERPRSRHATTPEVFAQHVQWVAW